MFGHDGHGRHGREVNKVAILRVWCVGNDYWRKLSSLTEYMKVETSCVLKITLICLGNHNVKQVRMKWRFLIYYLGVCTNTIEYRKG
jgi:hypothetical protein